MYTSKDHATHQSLTVLVNSACAQLQSESCATDLEDIHEVSCRDALSRAEPWTLRFRKQAFHQNHHVAKLPAGHAVSPRTVTILRNTRFQLKTDLFVDSRSTPPCRHTAGSNQERPNSQLTRAERKIVDCGQRRAHRPEHPSSGTTLTLQLLSRTSPSTRDAGEMCTMPKP